MEITKTNDPEVLNYLKGAPGRNIHADESGVHAQGIASRKARAASELAGLSPAGGREALPTRGGDLELEQACQMVLDYAAKADPGWAERIRVGRSVRDYTARQFCLALVGYMLDHEKHLEITPHPLLEPGAMALSEVKCAECEKPFIPDVPGRRFCSDQCGAQAWKRHEAMEWAKAKAEEVRLRQRRSLLIAGADV